MIGRLNKNNQPSKYRGVSLLELLLVVVVIAIMSVASVKFLSASTDQLKVETTARQINDLLQAGLMYQAINNVWPTASQLTSYTGGMSTTNAWGNAITISRTGSDTGQFIVSSTTPNNQLAARVAAELGSARSSGTTVTAYAGTIAQKPDPTIIVAGVGSKAQAPPPPKTITLFGASFTIDPYSKLGSWKGEGSHTEGAEYVNSILKAGGPITIPKPTCPTGRYNKRFAIYLAGLQKGCFMEAEAGSTIDQCAAACPTRNSKSPHVALDGIEDHRFCGFKNKVNWCIVGCTKTYTRGKGDGCCMGGIGAFGECWGYIKAEIKYKCKSYGALSDLWYLVNPVGAYIADNTMTNTTGFIDDVEIINVSETTRTWSVLVKTKTKQPTDEIIGMQYIGQFFDRVGAFFSGGAIADLGFGAVDNYRGAVSYMTYCEPY